jgi:uncharacterized membrane protein YgcG
MPAPKAVRRPVTLAALVGVVGALILGSIALAAPPVGPPYPAPVENVAVYDYADVLSAGTEQRAESIIDDVETRTGAEVAVYTQTQSYKVSEEKALEDAKSLMRQWGVGRKGFDDGLVILYDMDPSGCHGQVQLWAGDGYRAAFLDDSERQRIFNDDMLPYLERCDIDGSLLIALERVQANATPEHAARLETARQVNAVIGLVGGPAALLLLVGWAFFTWIRYGRDPEYLDSPSIHIPAPPKGMTAATGALVLQGSTPRRALTAALLDLASRGRVAFEEDPDAPKEDRLAGSDRALTIRLGEKAAELAREDLTAERGETDAVADARMALEDRRPLGPAEELLENALDEIAIGDTIEPSKVPELATQIGPFEEALEAYAVRLGWFAGRPGRSIRRWRVYASLEIVAGGALIVGGFAIPMSGLSVLGGCIAAAGIVTLVIAGFMPARTIAGAMARAWLAAYRRTLDKTMAQATSIRQVVDDPELRWLETPDQVVVWATALGLGTQLADLLKRSAQASGASGIAYYPTWYRSADGQPFGATGAAGAHGLFSSSGVPDFGGMVSALGTIGNAAAPTSSGGGGFGGGGGGGGGGAGGGF